MAGIQISAHQVHLSRNLIKCSVAKMNEADPVKWSMTVNPTSGEEPQDLTTRGQSVTTSPVEVVSSCHLIFVCSSTFLSLCQTSAFPFKLKEHKFVYERL